MLALVTPCPAAAASQRGLSLVEMMVGLALGLLVLGGALLLMTHQARALLGLSQSSRFDQDLQEALDVVVREIHRAGFRNSSKLDDAQDRLQWSQTPQETRIDWLSDTSGSVGPAQLMSLRLTGGVLQLKVDTQTGFQSLTDPAVADIQVLRLQSFKRGACIVAYRMDLQAIPRETASASSPPSTTVSAWAFPRNQWASECRS